MQSSEAPSVDARDAAPDQVTTVVLVRHAEKEDGDDPALTSEGRERATQLAHVLSEGGVDAIYASQFRRTQETAEAVASTVGLEVVVVDARDIEGLATRLRTEHAGETVLVVSHSNIVPEVIRALGADAEEIPEEEYDDLFVVLLNAATGDASAVHLNYGGASGGD
jgi:broad specificity phosphatase PhoE